MENNVLDEQLFTRERPPSLVRDELELIFDKNICLASYQVARIKANEQYRQYLDTEICELENAHSSALGLTNVDTFEFEGTNADAVEGITALSNGKLIRINGVAADIKTLAQLFELIFRRKLGKVYDIQYQNANRKKDPTPFLHYLIRAVTMKEDDK
jgi:RteC protein